MYKFEKLLVWTESVELLSLINGLCDTLPSKEKNNLIDQLRRAGTSISLNIAEGSGAENDREFKRYLAISRKSSFEVVAILKIIEKLYKIDTSKVLNKVEQITKMLTNLSKYLKKSLDYRPQTKDYRP